MTVTLAIETATEQVGVAIGGADAVIGSIRLSGGRRHAEVLAPAVESLTRLSGVPLEAVQRVAVDVGPGLFTGIRVGVATAKALASALDVPIVACSSLDLLAHPHRARDGVVAAVVDARRGEVFWALYRRGEATTFPVSTAPEALGEAVLGAAPVLATGDGARRYASVLEAAGARVAGCEWDHPRPEVLAALGSAGSPLEPNAVEPLYIRAPDVRIGWEVRG